MPCAFRRLASAAIILPRYRPAGGVDAPRCSRYPLRSDVGFSEPVYTQQPPSSSGPGHRLFMPATGVRFPLGVIQQTAAALAPSGFFLAGIHGAFGG
jgi:hypothetical protein